MKLFIDTANTDYIREANSLGIICGVTTNPSLIAKEGRDFKEVVREITSIVDGPISAEVISLDADQMVEEALDLVKIHKNIVVKIPMCREGLKACAKSSRLGIKTNMTLIFSPQQALLAAQAGASYVSPFIGRLNDVGANGVDIVAQIAEMFNIFNMDTQIIAASIRSADDVVKAALAGADIATVPYDILMKCIDHPLTTQGIEKFLKDWENVPKK